MVTLEGTRELLINCLNRDYYFVATRAEDDKQWQLASLKQAVDVDSEFAAVNDWKFMPWYSVEMTDLSSSVGQSKIELIERAQDGPNTRLHISFRKPRDHKRFVAVSDCELIESLRYSIVRSDGAIRFQEEVAEFHSETDYDMSNRSAEGLAAPRTRTISMSNGTDRSVGVMTYEEFRWIESDAASFRLTALGLPEPASFSKQVSPTNSFLRSLPIVAAVGVVLLVTVAFFRLRKS